jgi:hypothetical protein
MQEGSFNVNVLNVPVQRGGDVKYGAEGLETGSGCGGFVVVDKVPLSKAFGNVSDFVSSDVAVIVAFAFADKLASQRFLASWDGSARYEDENVEVVETFEFIPSPCDPKFPFG